MIHKPHSPPGVEVGERGHLQGRDPRGMSQDELRAMGFAPMSPTEAIRAHCLDCCAGSADEVRRCMALRCPSWPFRMGKSRWKAERALSEEQREAMRERARAMAAKRHGSAAGDDNLSTFGAGIGGDATSVPEAGLAVV
jgi:hypothetical protein